MTTRLFALIIGIDRYKSGRIWDLHSCVEDAQNVRKWLTSELNVPKSNICTLLDHDATKQNIETAFMQHLVNNPAIEPDDAILVYFSGHGSTVVAPPGWNDEQTSESSAKVHLLCTFDHDSATQNGRTSGISDCSLRSLLDDLAATKGNNITIMLDCCFAPAKNVRDRKFVRSTATTKVQADDLFRDLWVSARGKARSPKSNLFSPSNSYVLLSACAPDGAAFEGKEGGRFTLAFLHAVSGLPLHQATYPQLIDKMSELSGNEQRFVCISTYKNRFLFDQVPFPCDTRFSHTTFDRFTSTLKIDIGSTHGIVAGSRFSLHFHNQQHSKNPSFATAVVFDVHPTHSFARLKAPSTEVPATCWSKVVRWRNHAPFRARLKSTFFNFFQSWNFRRNVTAHPGQPPSEEEVVNVIHAKDSPHADISLAIKTGDTVAIQHHTLPHSPTAVPAVVSLQDRTNSQALNEAARFNLHLLHGNSEQPLKSLVEADLRQIQPVRPLHQIC